ncbi:MAG: efflux RND transporter periplasmic adaptor subunit [Planctomycetota bacterium]|jgi:RND family efflux transporter MFP subunit
MKLDKIKNLLKQFAADHRQLCICLGLILLATLITFLLLKWQRSPQRARLEKRVPLVKVQRLQARDIEMVIRGTGTVSPKVEVEISPQVAGKTVYVNEQFKAGGYIAAGETILEIDRRDYELAVQQRQAGVAEAQVRLDIEKAEGQIAAEEWKQLHPGSEPSSPLVLREPQIKQAQAKLESAKAALAAAQLNLQRTKLTLPIDVTVISEKVDLGQYVGVGKSLGQAYGVDFVEIELPLEDKELKWFTIPGTAEVVAEFAGGTYRWDGRVTRTTGVVDIRSRFVSVVVEVAKPFDASNGKVALMPGMFVEVLIKGNVLKNAIAVPRDAIHDENEVWIANNSGVRIQPLNIVRSDDDFAYTVSDINDGAMLIISSLDVVTDGMSVRINK